MTAKQPTPPADLPSDLVERLDRCSSERLREVSQYADALAEYKDSTDDQQEQPGENQTEDRPDNVPSKATTTIKEINDNRYYYWQWREGDSIKSKYKGPVDGG